MILDLMKKLVEDGRLIASFSLRRQRGEDSRGPGVAAAMRSEAEWRASMRRTGLWVLTVQWGVPLVEGLSPQRPPDSSVYAENPEGLEQLFLDELARSIIDARTHFQRMIENYHVLLDELEIAAEAQLSNELRETKAETIPNRKPVRKLKLGGSGENTHERGADSDSNQSGSVVPEQLRPHSQMSLDEREIQQTDMRGNSTGDDPGQDAGGGTGVRWTVETSHE